MRLRPRWDGSVDALIAYKDALEDLVASLVIPADVFDTLQTALDWYADDRAECDKLDRANSWSEEEDDPYGIDAAWSWLHGKRGAE